MPSVPSATILSPAQIAAYAQAAGFSGADLATAVAIALAESFPSGNPNSYNPESAAGAPPGEGSYGLWQIYLNVHPEYADSNLYDPQTNANAAYAIYRAAGGFSPWTTYGSGAYQTYVPAVMAALGTGSAPATLNSPVVADASVVPTGFSMETVLWIGAALVTGIFVWSLFE